MKSLRVALITVTALVLLGVGGVALENKLQTDEKVETPLQSTSENITADALSTIINDVRTQAGLNTLTYTSQLNTSASQKCSDMVAANYYAHVNPSTAKHGYQYIFENLPNAKNASENLNKIDAKTNKEVVDSWMNSDAHKAAILDSKYTNVGYAVCTNPSEPEVELVVQHFAELSSATSVEPQSSTSRVQSAPTTTVTPPSFLPQPNGVRCANDYVHPGSVVCRPAY